MTPDDIAQAVLAVAVDHPMWIGEDGQPLDYLPEREARIGDFVHEVAEALAPLVDQSRRQTAVAALQRIRRLAARAYPKGLVATATVVADLNEHIDRIEKGTDV
jgi:hypothetical protein